MLVHPVAGPGRVGALVLSGSSGRIETGRARLLADVGVSALAYQWFGCAGQAPGICEIPLEELFGALDRLGRTCDRLAVIGLSKGAEAALLTAVHDSRVDVVVAISPPHVVWANVGPGSDGRDRPLRSSWTLGGAPLPFVPYVESWVPRSDPPAYRELYESSLSAFADAADAAAIPVERIAGTVVLVAGGDDQVWPSQQSVEVMAARRAAHGLSTVVVVEPAAGHRPVLPGEQPAPGADLMRGGTPAADRRLGERAWSEILRALA